MAVGIGMKTSISVDATSIEGKIDRKIYGHFVENMASCVYGGLLRNTRRGRPEGPWVIREDLVGHVARLEPPVIRWPGGLFADGYDWRNGIGPADSRPLNRNKYWSRYGPFTRVLDPNVFGTDEFLSLCERLGAEAYLNVNMGTGSAAEAARWVQYANGASDTPEGSRRASNGRERPYGVKYWGVGNEAYGFWSLSRSKPREYARRYLEFKHAMEQEDDGLRYVAVGCEPYFNKTWNRAVFDEAASEIDMLSVHIYLPGPERIAGVYYSFVARGGAGVYRSVVASPYEYERRLLAVEQDIVAATGRSGGATIAFDEWNQWWSPKQLIRPRWKLRDALYVCGMFHVMHRMGSLVEMANIAQLVNVLGVLVTKGDKVARTAIYYPFLMYSTLTGERKLKVETECLSFDSNRVGGIPSMKDVPLLDCSATLSDDGRKLVLFVINREDIQDVSADIELGGFEARGKVELHLLNGPDIEAENSFACDEVVSVRKSVLDAGDVLPRWKFAAHSVTAMVFGA
jgi:alpha-N-arabinofuranosidase